MAIAQEFKEAVDNKKLLRTRIMLKDSMVVDPTFREFNELIAYAEVNLSDLYVPHDGETLNNDMNSWTKDYMDEQMVVLVNNFSKERVELLKSIVKKVYGARAQVMEQNRTRNNQSSSGSQVTKKQVGTGLVVGGAVVAVAGICISEGILIAAGAAATVAGVAIMVTDK